jgi:hypothetical protein
MISETGAIELFKDHPENRSHLKSETSDELQKINV